MIAVTVDFRKYLIAGFYILSVFILLYAAVNNEIDGSKNVNINGSWDIEGRKVTFSGYWSDKKITADMIKSGAISEDKFTPGDEVWIANINVKSLKENYVTKVGVGDFQLIDSSSKKYDPAIDAESEFQLKKGQEAELQLVFLIPPETNIRKILYSVRENPARKLLIDLNKD